MGRLGLIAMLSLFLVAANLVFAYGYGTSSIALSSYSGNIIVGSTVNVNYTVNLASGQTWGTNLGVVNNNQLSAAGITVTLSNPSGNPPFSGTMSVNTAGLTKCGGTYNITLAATGDDPSTSNVNYTLKALCRPTLIGNATTTQSQVAVSCSYVGGKCIASSACTASGGTCMSAPNDCGTGCCCLARRNATTSPTTTQVSRIVGNYTSGNYYTAGPNMPMLATLGLTILILLGMLYGFVTWKSMLTRLVIIGTALILIGTVVWLYGDYAGGIQQYIWGGVGAIILGTLVWVYGDMAGGTFKQSSASTMAYIGIALIAIGLIGWVYGELYAPGKSLYWWGGTILLIVGTVVWLMGDGKAGAFLKRSTKK